MFVVFFDGRKNDPSEVQELKNPDGIESGDSIQIHEPSFLTDHTIDV